MDKRISIEDITGKDYKWKSKTIGDKFNEAMLSWVGALDQWKESFIIDEVYKRTGRHLNASNALDFGIEHTVCYEEGWEEYTMKGEKLVRFEDRNEDESFWIECITYEKNVKVLSEL